MRRRPDARLERHSSQFNMYTGPPDHRLCSASLTISEVLHGIETFEMVDAERICGEYAADDKLVTAQSVYRVIPASGLSLCWQSRGGTLWGKLKS